MFLYGQREGHADGWVVVYSISDRESFKVASTALGKVWSLGHVTHRAVILVGNKTDLERTRVVNTSGEREKVRAAEKERYKDRCISRKIDEQI